MIRVTRAIKNLAPGAEFVSCSNKTKSITRWLSPDITEPTQAEIDAEMKLLQAEYDAQEYARKRQAEYPSIEELVVALYDTDDKSAIEAKRAEVKKKYPKP